MLTKKKSTRKARESKLPLVREDFSGRSVDNKASITKWVTGERFQGLVLFTCSVSFLFFFFTLFDPFPIMFAPVWDVQLVTSTLTESNTYNVKSFSLRSYLSTYVPKADPIVSSFQLACSIIFYMTKVTKWTGELALSCCHVRPYSCAAV